MDWTFLKLDIKWTLIDDVATFPGDFFPYVKLEILNCASLINNNYHS